MSKLSIALALAATTAVSIAGSLALPSPAEAALPVFDVTNYGQNLLQAARALEQINTQVKSLQNESSMFQNMARNLKRIDFPELEAIKSAMSRVDQLMDEAQGIGFKIDGLDQKIRAMFPGALDKALTGDEQIAAARARLDAAMASYRQEIDVQAEVAKSVSEDRALLSDLVGRSQAAEGALQVGQAANQLMALSVKQQFQLQQLMASSLRSEALERSRRAQAEEEGRAATRRFLGSGKAYTAPGN